MAEGHMMKVGGHQQSLLIGLNEQRLRGLFCDVTIQVEQHAFCMHRCVLAAASPVLNAFLCSVSDSDKLSVLENVSAVAFGKVMDFLYSGEIDLNVKDVNAVLIVARCLELKVLEQTVVEFIEKSNVIIDKHEEKVHGVKEESALGLDSTNKSKRLSGSEHSHMTPPDVNVDKNRSSYDMNDMTTEVLSGSLEHDAVQQSGFDTVQQSGFDTVQQSGFDTVQPSPCDTEMQTNSESTVMTVLNESKRNRDAVEIHDSVNTESKQSEHSNRESHNTSFTHDELIKVGDADSPDKLAANPTTGDVPDDKCTMDSNDVGINDNDTEHGQLSVVHHEENLNGDREPKKLVRTTPKTNDPLVETQSEETARLNTTSSVQHIHKDEDLVSKNDSASIILSGDYAAIERKCKPSTDVNVQDLSRSIGTRSKCKKQTEVKKLNLNKSRAKTETVKINKIKSKHDNESSGKKIMQNSNKRETVINTDSENPSTYVRSTRRNRGKRKTMDDDFVFDIPNLTSTRIMKNNKSPADVEAGSKSVNDKNDRETVNNTNKSAEQSNENEEERKGRSKRLMKKKIEERSAMQQETFPCGHCDETFSMKSHLLAHVSTHMDAREFACELCKRRFSLKQNLKRHVRRMHTNERPHECKVCGRSFKANVDLQYHMNSRHSTAKHFKCSECDRSFKNYTTLRIHQRIHKIKRKSKCEFCDVAFSTRFDLFQHTCTENLTCSDCKASFNKYGAWMRHVQSHGRRTYQQTKHAADKRYTCTVCSVVFTVRADLLDHMRSHDGGVKPFTCGTCGQQFSNENYLKVHETTHTAGKKPHACMQCDASFMMKSNLKRHVLTLHDNVKPIACDTCGKRFADTASMRTHAVTHTGQKPYKCPECDKSFSTTSNLSIHMKAHSGLKPFQCDTCHMTFHMKSLLNAHKKLHFTPDMTTCKVCDKVFPNARRYHAHMRQHKLGDKPYVCEICGNQFTSSNGLMYHTMIHTGQKPHVCTVCNRRFRSATTLATHVKTHTGDKPIMCEVCGDKFTSKSSLKSHSRIHMTDKRFACDQCSQKFHFNYDLKRHLVCHSSDKPFKCDVCSKSFKRRLHMERHWATHLGHRPLACDWCKLKFLTCASLIDHLTKDHQRSAEEAQTMAQTEENNAKAAVTKTTSRSRLRPPSTVSDAIVRLAEAPSPVVAGQTTYVDVPAQVLECIQELDEKTLLPPPAAAITDIAYQDLSEAMCAFDAAEFDPGQVQVHIAENVEGLQEGQTYVFVQLESVDVVIPDAQD